MIADDLFAGAGGWDLAAEALGIHARGIENMPAARATRDAAGLTTIHDDVWTYEPDGAATGLIASPPCQTFSAAGKGTGRKALDDVLALIPDVPFMSLTELRSYGEAFGDERTALVLTPLWLAIHHPYRWLAWEQVPQVLPVWEACAEVLRLCGCYEVWTGYLHSEQYGVPQTRKRAFLLANFRREVAPPTPTHSRYHSRTPDKLDPGVAKWVSMAEALGWGLSRRPSPTVTGGGTETGGAEPIAKLARYAGRDDFVVRTGNFTARDHRLQRGVPYERSIDVPAPTVLGNTGRWTVEFAGAGQTAVDTAGQRRRSLDEPAHTITGKGTAAWCPTPALDGETAEDCDWVHDRPSPTIVGTFAPDVVAKPGYRKAGDPPRQKTPGSVRVTVEEAGVLQSFPADFPWNGGPKDSSGKKYLQAGNAVPPLMALHALAAATGLAIPTDTAEEAVA